MEKYKYLRVKKVEDGFKPQVSSPVSSTKGLKPKGSATPKKDDNVRR